ncbi:hypothetical protein [Candidatus Nanohalovita haloferacivicina]|uniref:hypothetical protein n=1 Tax=Candidatus Nanohalovita haloferacivicina TaxID=2978046 RepID=UPI00325FAC4E|nr:hypothetical protein HBNXNv_0088 [Candidatus Nanohalobia archaeon BNXNv]
MGFVEKYGVAIVAILIGGGFAFGGIASYSGLTSGGGSNNNQQQDVPQLPSQSISEGPLDLTSREKSYLAAVNDVVFVTGYYNTSEGRSQVETVETVQSNFGEKMYLNYVNTSEIPAQTQLQQTPAVHVVGAVIQNRQAVPQQGLVYNITEQNVASSTCSYIRELPDSAVVYCFG